MFRRLTYSSRWAFHVWLSVYVHSPIIYRTLYGLKFGLYDHRSPFQLTKLPSIPKSFPAYIRWMINDKSWQSFSLAKRYFFSSLFWLCVTFDLPALECWSAKLYGIKKKPRKCWSSSYIYILLLSFYYFFFSGKVLCHCHGPKKIK
jgi:hypothetical protein